MQTTQKEMKLLKEITLLCKKKEPSRSKLNEYRNVIIFLKINNYTLQEIAEFLQEKNISTSAPNICNYLKKYPITEDEYSDAEQEYGKIKTEAIKERNEEFKKTIADKN